MVTVDPMPRCSICARSAASSVPAPIIVSSASGTEAMTLGHASNSTSAPL